MCLSHKVFTVERFYKFILALPFCFRKNNKTYLAFCEIEIGKVEVNMSTKPLKVRDKITSKRKQSLSQKKIADGKSDGHLCCFMAKAGLALTLWPERAVLQVCYGRNFHLKPTPLQRFLKFSDLPKLDYKFIIC